MTKGKGDRYPSEFRESAVRLAIESGKPVSHTAAELGISADTMYGWIKRHSKPKQTKASMREINYDTEEVKRLRKELARVTQERDILKKATAYFAKEMR